METLTPIRLRYTGEVIDLTTAYDDQEIVHTEPVELRTQLHEHHRRPRDSERSSCRGNAVHQRLAEEKGHRRSWCNYCYLRFGLEITVRMLDEIKTLGFLFATRAGISIGIDDMVIPDSKAGLVKRRRKERRRGAAAISRRRHHQRRTLQQGH